MARVTDTRPTCGRRTSTASLIQLILSRGGTLASARDRPDVSPVEGTMSRILTGWGNHPNLILQTMSLDGARP